jgi:regulator of protease activity HflC (stomatin/prohibitin superfamily)
MEEWIIYTISFFGVAGVALLAISIRVVKQYERGVLFRFGKLRSVREPGFNMIIPIADRMTKVSLRIVTTVLQPQEVITKDNVTVKVDAVVYYKVIDPEKAIINVQDYQRATIQLALTTLRSVLGQSDLDDLLSKRDQINTRMRDIIEEQTEEPWGVRAMLIEVKDVLLPETMQRAMAKQAEAEREKRAKIIHAHGEQQAAKTLAEAAEIMQSQPVSLQLRYLQTLVEMAGEKNSTIIPLTVDIVNALSHIKTKKGDK